MLTLACAEALARKGLIAAISRNGCIMTVQDTPVPRLRRYQGPAVLSYGFRPFFLLGSAYAGLAVLAWLPVFLGELTLQTAFAPRD